MLFRPHPLFISARNSYFFGLVYGGTLHTNDYSKCITHLEYIRTSSSLLSSSFCGFTEPVLFIDVLSYWQIFRKFFYRRNHPCDAWKQTSVSHRKRIAQKKYLHWIVKSDLINLREEIQYKLELTMWELRGSLYAALMQQPLALAPMYCAELIESHRAPALKSFLERLKMVVKAHQSLLNDSGNSWWYKLYIR